MAKKIENRIAQLASIAAFSAIIAFGLTPGTDAFEPKPIPAEWDQKFSTARNTPITIILEGRDYHNAPLTFHIIKGPARGSLGPITPVSESRASVIYTPVNFAGTDSFTFRSFNGTFYSNGATAFIFVGIPTDDTPPLRSLQWPLKTSRSLFTDEMVAQARWHYANDNTYRSSVSGYISNTAPWIQRSNKELYDMLPDWRIPRAFDACSNTRGCPVHGIDVYNTAKHLPEFKGQVSGTYPWVCNIQDPYRLRCPVGGEYYPDNDFAAYYKSGMNNHALLIEDKYVDPGRGYVDPATGEKYWFVAYACHRAWQSWISIINQLAHAYMVTGDRIYAEKAIVMLDRIAEVYPGMDHSVQSRYSEMMGGTYKGKIVNYVWETGLFQSMVMSYELVFDALTGDDPLSLSWDRDSNGTIEPEETRTADQIRANIEANIIEEGIDGSKCREIVGNIGMREDALTKAIIVRQNGPTDSMLDALFGQTGVSYLETGLKYTMYNCVLKDGMPFERAAGYAFGWVINISRVALLLPQAGTEDHDLYTNDKFKMLLDGPIDLVCADAFTPCVGDAGAINAGFCSIGSPGTREIYKAGYKNIGNPAYAWLLDRLGYLADNKIRTDDDFFIGFDDATYASAISDAAAYKAQHKPKSRFFDGWGVAILNNQDNSDALALTYGGIAGHRHYDILNFELFGTGHRLTPDLGYPDAMNSYVSGIFSWSTHTISHNTLTVDQTRQSQAYPAKIARFHDSGRIHVVDTQTSPGAVYKSQTVYGSPLNQVDTYRRTLVMVDVDDKNSYVVDVFRVKGGTKDYVLSIHGGDIGSKIDTDGQMVSIPDSFVLTGAEFSTPETRGTLAGIDVPYGALYDDPVLGSPDYSRGYTSYLGSGYSHFFNWQKAAPQDPVTGEWKLVNSPTARLRVHVIPGRNTEQEITVADARVSPRLQTREVLKYMLLKRPVSPAGETFVNVWEMTGAGNIIDHIETYRSAPLGIGSDEIVILTIYRTDGKTDTIAVSPESGITYTIPGIISSDAAVAVATRHTDGMTDIFAAGGSTVSVNNTEHELAGTLQGEVTSVDYVNKVATIEFGTAVPPLDKVVGKAIRIYNGKHSCIYTIKEASINGNTLTCTLAGSSIFTGLVKITQSVQGAPVPTLRTNVHLPYATYYASGMHLVSKDFSGQGLIDNITYLGTAQYESDIKLASGSSTAPFAVGDDAWITDFGIGDYAQIEMVSSVAGLPIPGDINYDGLLNIIDMILVAKDFGKTEGFNPACDINGDGIVNIIDLIHVARNYGR